MMRDNNTPALHVTYEGVGVKVQFDSFDRIEGRCSWGYRLYDEAFPTHVLAEGADLRTPDRATAFEAFEALISFVEAWDEAWQGDTPVGANNGMFPQLMRGVLDWQRWCFHVREYVCGSVADGEAATQQPIEAQVVPDEDKCQSPGLPEAGWTVVEGAQAWTDEQRQNAQDAYNTGMSGEGFR